MGSVVSPALLTRAMVAASAVAVVRFMLRWRASLLARRRVDAVAPPVSAGGGRHRSDISVRAFSGDRPARRSAAGWLGCAILIRAPPEFRERWARCVGAGVLACVLVGTLQPALAPLAALSGASTPLLLDRRARRLRGDQIQRALPDVIDLLGLAVGAGCNPVLALRHVVARGEGEVIEALRAVLRVHDAGQRLADTLDSLPQRLGQPGRPCEAVRPLVGILTAAERYGAPLLEPLSRLAADARATRRQMAETAARRLPIKLIFPLIICILPAFGLLTVAPLLASGLKSLRL